MMDWHESATSAGDVFLMITAGLFWVVLLAGGVWLLTRLLAGRAEPGTHPEQTGAQATGEAPEETLDRLFASGEIDEFTYRIRRTTLAEMRQGVGDDQAVIGRAGVDQAVVVPGDPTVG